MSIHYKAVEDRIRYHGHFGAKPPADMGEVSMKAGKRGTFIRGRIGLAKDQRSILQREALVGSFGLVMPWPKDAYHDTQYLDIVRSETAAVKRPSREAWARSQHCIIPAECFFKQHLHIQTVQRKCVSMDDDQPMGIAGLWAASKSELGVVEYRYAMLSVNADSHPLMRQFRLPTVVEKRTVLVLPKNCYGDWLNAQPEESMDFIENCPDATLIATPSFPSRANQYL